jgi:hypothetical protein
MYISDWLTGLDDRGVRVRVPARSRITSTYRPDRFWVHPTSYPMGTAGTLLGGGGGSVKRQAYEADHSPPSSSEIKKTWIYTSIPSYAFMAPLQLYNFTTLPY